MTAKAIGRGVLKLAVHVAGGAFNTRMCADQRKLGELAVVKPGALPPVEAVTVLALYRKLRCLVIQRHSLLVVSQVAGSALCISSLEIRRRGTLVARLASHGGMRAH